MRACDEAALEVIHTEEREMTTENYQTNSHVAENNLVHGDLDLDGGVNLDGGDASHDVHGTTHETIIRTLTQPDRSLSCGFSSRGAPKSWYPHRKGTCGW